MPTQDAKKFEHESYAVVSFSRVQGNIGRLFGSALENHYTTIRLRIARASREHSLGRDWYSSAGQDELIEVELSAAQFAELLTTMNVGNGVPCTLRHLGGKKIADVPDELHEIEEVREEFRNDAEKLGKQMREMLKKATGLLSSKSPPNKAQREEILESLRMMVQHVESNMPFMAEQFQEVTDKMVTAAKSEVDAFVTHNVMAEGLRSLTEKADVKTALELKAKSEDHEDS